MSEICPRLHFGHFHRVGCRFSLLSLVPSRGYFLPLLATTSRLGPRTRAADEATAALNSRHTISAVYSGSTGNKEDTLSAKRSYILVREAPQLYSAGPPRSARLCRPCRFFQMQVADKQVVISRQFCTTSDTNIQH